MSDSISTSRERLVAASPRRRQRDGYRGTGPDGAYPNHRWGSGMRRHRGEMPGHDVVIVEGYRKSGLPTIEIMRAGNKADARTAEVFAEGARKGWALGTDFTQFGRGSMPHAAEVHPDDRPRGAAFRPGRGGPPRAQLSRPCRYLQQDANGRNGRGGHRYPAGCRSRRRVRHPGVRYQRCGRAGGFSASDLRAPARVHGHPGWRREPPHGSQQGNGPVLRPAAHLPFGRAVSPVADELIVTTNEPKELAFLQEQYPELGIRFESDVINERGALPGLYGPFAAPATPMWRLWLATWCSRSPSLVVAEALEMTRTGADVVVPVNKHGFEPFHAIYRRSGCLPAVREALNEGGEARPGVLQPGQRVRVPAKEGA